MLSKTGRGTYCCQLCTRERTSNERVESGIVLGYTDMNLTVDRPAFADSLVIFLDFIDTAAK